MNIVNISIQLDEQHVKKIHYLEQQLNMQLESLIQKGIDVLYEQQQHKSSKAFQILQETGFIGCMEGDGNLSENYKNEIYLDDKL